mgnify:CR=1 FL=1
MPTVSTPYAHIQQFQGVFNLPKIQKKLQTRRKKRENYSPFLLTKTILKLRIPYVTSKW